MEQQRLQHLLPNLKILAEAFPGCRMQLTDAARIYRDARLFRPGTSMEPDLVYLVRPEQAGIFPGDSFTSICTAPISGGANRLTVESAPADVLFDTLQALFSRCREQEMILDELVFRKASLQELCEAGARLLGNPVYIHDDWFMMLARSAEVEQVITPEYPLNSERGFVPKAIVDELQYDDEFLQTYSRHGVQKYPLYGDGSSDCLYVNLFEATVYRGRLLVMEHNHPFRQLDYVLAEVLAQRALTCLLRKESSTLQPYRSMDDVVYEMLQGKRPDTTELRLLMEQLGWASGDSYLCIAIRIQEENSPAVVEHSLHADLFRCFPGCYILLRDHQQFVLLNMRVLNIPYSLLRYTLAPLCRDYGFYAGISSPVNGIRDLTHAYQQSLIAINHAFRLRNEKWILLFSECALSYIMESIASPLPVSYLVSPALLTLMDHDKVHGTSLFETLREYLLLERDIPKTSEKLIIHRTTLLYRLKKIQSLCPLNLDDREVRLYLLLSLWLLEKDQSLQESQGRL